ncbi:MAG: SDR family NAD(P)-dependent oxidoreductase [bacterium]|nr:SDR family NAD(P)-dependent oxidoreductase [bacterium]
MAISDPTSSAIVVGVGPESGLGGALCRRLGREGLHVFVAGRTPENIERVADSIRKDGGSATPVVTDATVEEDVIRLFDVAQAQGPVLELVIYNAGNNAWGSFVEMEAEFFENMWRVGCFGGFLVGREAARRLAPLKKGSVLFMGATASLRGRPPFTAFASAKAGLRAITQAMAREFGPQGIHVAHVVIDGAVDGDKINRNLPDYAKSKGEDGMLNIEAVSDTFWMLHKQHRSAWTLELDLRPFKETF